MLASVLSGGTSFFWSRPIPDEPRNGRNSLKILESCPGKPKKREVRCKVMQALQRSLSEAQKLGIAVQQAKILIRAHKASCPNCQMK